MAGEILDKDFKRYLINYFNDHKNWKLIDKEPQVDLQKATILASLDEVFLDDELKDDVVTRVSIPELLEGSEPGYSGVILYGPPGTGKTVLLKAICDTYQKAGAYAKEVSAAAINEGIVGAFARNLEREITTALAEANQRKKPSFLSFDEGSILAGKASEGAWSVAKHYQEAIDVLKRYLGNNKKIVIGISTNELPESFEDALTREGRLTPYFVGYPDVTQRAKMWRHFSAKYDAVNLTDEQAQRLAEETDAEQGAFIEEFCRNYQRTVRASLLKVKGFRTLVEALKNNVNIGNQKIRESMTFDRMYGDVQATLGKKYKRMKAGEPEKKRVGFHS